MPTAQQDQLRDLPAFGDPNEVVKAFAACAPFRAATVDELINDANPFRRPVRPDDLDFLDYSTELSAEACASLSALLGHRMLLNAYEADLVFLPQPEPSPSWADGQTFYAPESRLLAELARPVLERHLFSFVDQPPADAPGATASLVDHVIDEYERLGADDQVGAAIRALKDPAAAMLFLVLQLSGAAPSRAAALGRCALGDDGGAIDVTGAFFTAFQQERQRLAFLRELLLGCGLSDAPRAYWQFYLGSTLATATYLHRVCRDRTRLFEAVGALVHETVVRPLRGAQHGALAQDVLDLRGRYFDVPQPTTDELRAQVEAIVSPLLDRYGDVFASDCRKGFDTAQRLAAIAADDLVTQVGWADELERAKATGDAIRRHLHDNAIVVDLDTFVESAEVTSTTHVHDDHRLVVIEQGEMHFWNNVGPKIPLSTGDAILIPKARLHGSTVLSGECTYHQPIIPDSMLEQFS
jgi:hypothetical protein